jgi:aspartate-semialdehyde dehydrogenase
LGAHPWFAVRVLAASTRSAGRRYAEAVSWKLPEGPPRELAELEVVTCEPARLDGCELWLSALDAPLAREIEPALRERGLAVVSNSSALRMSDDVPLVVPEVNAADLAHVSAQRARHRGGFVVTNPNCAVIGLALGIWPLDRAFGVRRIVVTTLQALSGAGLSGPAALDLVDNVIPHIEGEEEKIERELSKVLGKAVPVSAHCHRVGVHDGHLAAVSLELDRAATPAEAVAVLREFRATDEIARLPSGLARPLIVRDEPDRPQPRLDRDAGGGMAVVIGRVRSCPVLGLKLELLSHNAVRGAAGGTLLIAELLAARGLVGEVRA